MTAEKVAPTAGLDGKDLSTATHQDATSTGSSGDVERAANDLGSDGEHAFSDPKVAEYWRGVYENAKYECRHRFDPSATWTPEEEARVVRKTDLRLLTWLCLMFFGLQLDRGMEPRNAI